MAVRVVTMTLRACGTLALILGLLSWLNLVTSLVGLHMLFGIAAVLVLWTLGVVQARGTGGNVGLAAGAFLAGLLLIYVGLNQRTMLPGSSHWVIQFLHLVLGLTAVGIGEMCARRYRSRINGGLPPAFV